MCASFVSTWPSRTPRISSSGTFFAISRRQSILAHEVVAACEHKRKPQVIPRPRSFYATRKDLCGGPSRQGALNQKRKEIVSLGSQWKLCTPVSNLTALNLRGKNGNFGSSGIPKPCVSLSCATKADVAPRMNDRGLLSRVNSQESRV